MMCNGIKRISLLLLIVVCLSACTNNNYFNSTDNPKSQSSNIISYEQAKEIALTKVGGGTVHETDLDHKNGIFKNGILVYEVEINYNGIKYEIDVNSATGEIVKYEPDNNATRQQSSAIPSQLQNGSETNAKITYERAKEIALTEVGGGTVKEIDLDYEYGRLVYEIEIRNNNREYEIDIDAMTGEIVRYK